MPTRMTSAKTLRSYMLLLVSFLQKSMIFLLVKFLKLNFIFAICQLGIYGQNRASEVTNIKKTR